MRLFVFAMFTATVLFSEISVAEFDTSACEKALSSKADQMDCQLSFSTNAQERDDLIKKTYGFIHNVTCRTQLNFSKSDVLFYKYKATRSKLPSKFQLKEHQIGCDIQTKDERFKIDMTLKPYIQFDKDGVSEVDLNFQKVTGVPSFIGNKLIKYGNSPEVQRVSKKALNEFLKKF
ncbi:conserved hypothetical protein, secreted [Candidatus Thiomargarita nelsonii]|uniref:Uncharacterized protein n=1 Tax=Candidatus Thiomargarita nelsonii TaxID=1003181 RepID=A0A0A6P294_9GAMM|nr:conserved hypothetical protein, secreted [Candidatus Thiomargarita nelsonii]